MRFYRDRWKEVEAVEREELRNSTVEQRWRQLNAILGLAVALGIKFVAVDKTEVYQRWAKIKDKAAEPTHS